MEKYMLTENVKVYCTTAKSFPEGIQEAFISLEKMLLKEGRTFYGISYCDDKGSIVYKAGVSETYDGEAEKYGFETFIITQGQYLAETIVDWRDNIAKIGNTFQTLFRQAIVDKTYPCVEWYKSDKEVVCMVRVNSAKSTNGLQ
jgi:hypothetical protein